MSVFDRFDRKPPSERVVDILPLYCGRCGKRLERIAQSLGFSPDTGLEQHQYWLSCPDAEHKDTPYQPDSYRGSRARYVTCDLKAWAETSSPYSFDVVRFINCAPWPKPKVEPEAVPS